MKIELLVIVMSLGFFGFGFSTRKEAFFVPETVAQHSGKIQYNKIATSSYFGLIGQNSNLQCSEVCLHEDSCEGFYIKDGACVFGVSGDVTAIEKGEK